MPRINSYLTFNGNCREAMTFYKECLGGQLTLQSIGESPLADKMSEQMKGYIVHATLTNGPISLMASDMVSEQGLTIGNSVSLMLDCGNEQQINDFYNKLSADGEATHPVSVSFWGALFGDLTDKFGNHWLLHYDKNSKSL